MNRFDRSDQRGVTRRLPLIALLALAVLYVAVRSSFAEKGADTSGLGNTVDSVMTGVMLFITLGGAVFLVLFYRRADLTSYDPPFGKSPTMPGHFERMYERKDLKVNSFGELVHDPNYARHKEARARMEQKKRERREKRSGALDARQQPPSDATSDGVETVEPPLARASTPPAVRGTKRRVLAAPRAGKSVDTTVEVGPLLHEDGSLPTPQEIFDAMGRYVIGQDAARRTLAVAVYNHYKRTASNWQPHSDVEIAKSNILMLGPTGTGKTLMVQTLARILDVPLAIADATSLTDKGYVGEDVESVLARLIQAAGSVEAARLGIIYIDEIDKIAKSANTGILASHSDPSGEGVQQGLLKLLEGSLTSVPPLGGRSSLFQRDAQLDTTNILFICGGAFVGLTDIVRRRVSGRSVGFSSASISAKADLSDDELLAYVEPQDLYKFGLIPEFVGRIPIITHTNTLTTNALVRILTEPKNALISQYKELFAYDGIELEFDDEALRAMGDAALARLTGARGLRSLCEEILAKPMFELPGRTDVARVVVHEGCVTRGEDPEYLAA